MALPGRRVGGHRRVPADLRGRGGECGVIDDFLGAVRAGAGRALVVHGEPGVGKTALLDHLVERASGCRLARAAGVESEMELAYAGLHQLLTPMLHRVDELPGPQCAALQTAFGLRSGPVPDRFLVGLATLSLLAEVAEEHPLICLVDDAQWLDHASAQVLGFVGRRLVAECVGLVFATRGAGNDLAGLPELRVGGLGDADARALLAAALTGPLDAQVIDRLVAETRGNPLALLELPQGLTPAELAGGFALPDAIPLSGRIEESFRRRLDALPAETGTLLLAAAAEPVGDPVLVWRAIERLGVPADAATPAVEAGLLEVGARVRFRHPLVRSAVYRSASPQARQRAHLALAEATDAGTDPDRRAWHRAHATLGPDEPVAAELERSAARARARGGLAAAAAFLRRAVTLTADPARRTDRVLAAAQASFRAGALDPTLALLTTVDGAALDESQRARVEMVRGQVAFAVGSSDAAPLLLRAASRLAPLDLGLAREIYLTAWGAASTGGHSSGAGVLLEICRAVRALPPTPGGPRPLDLLLDGLAALITDGRATATPTLQRAAAGLADIPVDHVLRWGWMAPAASNAVWDNDGALAIATRQVRLLRDAGALAELPLHLSSLSLACAWTGDFDTVAANIAEADSVAAVTGSRFAPYSALRMHALQGRETELSVAIEQAEAAGPGVALYGHWAAAVLHNGLAHYRDAVSAATTATSNTFEHWVSAWALPELVEAAARVADEKLARDALDRLADTTRPAGTDAAVGIEARSRALVSHGARAEELYREAIDRLSRTTLRPELARAYLLYGEWLRRDRRRLDARVRLRTAHDMFTAIGMDAFAARSARELAATGERVRKRATVTRGALTAQEFLIARLARDGLSNPEIGARLFLSARTVKYHLGKVFTKLDIGSRAHLDRVLPGDGAAVPPH
ncbi:helix-turn-helix transcriptional regulator [Virgisporangium aurantiacum]|uniref:Transcriptional regulator n=1 Tax=Virgisporangium aurantiacum TaxID=175570 RepID=A0A8J4DZV0_9ACTN|nr:LuxR family transcriptional regulator [Virgisporangium aurantiacum]GIJ54402.1 transcriptional regulator [Virgisporangium aurantiacum]